MDEDLIAYLEKKVKTLEAENQKLRKAIRNAGFQILQTSGDWSIHDVSDLAKNDEECTNQVIAENIDLRMELVAMKAERDHWKANHDNQVKLKHEITRRPSRFVEMVKEIESLKRQLAAAPHWVPAEEYRRAAAVLHKQLIGRFGNGKMFTCYLSTDRNDNRYWQSDSVNLNATVTHVLVGLNPPASSEDPRGDGDQ